jgi:competence protein ComEA
MSIYRNVIAILVAVSFASITFAADETIVTTTANQPTVDTQAAVNTTETSSTTTTTTTTTSEKTNINTATQKELMKVKGLNAAKAKAIVSWRKKHGEFKSIDDLKQVKGFKKLNEATWQNLQDRLTIS